ncbi:histidine decarboxylase [Stylonychia lemnae]|uniref:Histidine decarboxylase n=1 Tax=Stylonychia lemnae TaxID=5949 RepID=A0A078A7D4_STYLE|nr:histidine decarboxylase [Stylonychia lemnae]|eukprot:CDW77452.1 histidine decarboxylase [Stylonychia lemnae]
MNLEEQETRKKWLLYLNEHIMSYCQSIMTMIYNKHPDLDAIDTTFYPTNSDGTKNMAESFDLSYGDPFDLNNPWKNPLEKEVVEILGKLLGFQDMSGYVTASECEANFSCIWWCKLFLLEKSNYKIKELIESIEAAKQDIKNLRRDEEFQLRNLKNQEIYELSKQLKNIQQPILICSRPPYTDISIIKAAQVMHLKTCYVKVNEDGSMNTQSLRVLLNEFSKDQAFNFIISLNLGTQIGGSFDDLLTIRKVIQEVQQEFFFQQKDGQYQFNNYGEDQRKQINNWNFVFHGDALLYGPTLTILKQYGDQIKSLREEGLDTMSISLWKFLGCQIPAAVSLTYKDFTDFAFQGDNFIEYVSTSDKVAFTGTRSGLTSMCAVHLLKTLKIDKNQEILRKLIQYDMSLADYLCQRLLQIFSQDQIQRRYLHSVIFHNVNKELIDEFIEELLNHFKNSNENTSRI